MEHNKICDPHILYNIVLQTRLHVAHRAFLHYRPYVTLIRHEVQSKEIFNALVYMDEQIFDEWIHVKFINRADDKRNSKLYGCAIHMPYYYYTGTSQRIQYDFYYPKQTKRAFALYCGNWKKIRFTQGDDIHVKRCDYHYHRDIPPRYGFLIKKIVDQLKDYLRDDDIFWREIEKYTSLRSISALRRSST